MKKRIWLTSFWVFVIAGAISSVFNVLLEGAYPVVQFFVGAIFTALAYGLFTYILCMCKNDIKTPSKMFLCFIEAFCVFSTIGFATAILTQKDTAWWMYLVYFVLAVFVGYKSYKDAKIVNF